MRRTCLAAALIGVRAARPAGITAEQATRGAGAVFRLAAQRLSPAEFSIIAGSLSGVERLLDAAPAVAAEAGGLDGLALPFSLLGMPASLIPAFVAIVLDFARANGSEPAEGLLRRTLLAP